MLRQSGCLAGQVQVGSGPLDHAVCVVVLDLLVAKCDPVLYWRIFDRSRVWDSAGHDHLHVYLADWTVNFCYRSVDQRVLVDDPG